MSRIVYCDHLGNEIEAPKSDVIKTNADRIRAMTDEELAEWLEDRFPVPINGLWLDWLKQEAEI